MQNDKVEDVGKFKVGEKPLLVFMHENAGNIGVRIPYFQMVIENLGVNVLSMAYRGYSYSDKEAPTEEGLKKDADAIIEFLRDPSTVDASVAEHINPQLVFAQGRSLGSAVGLYMVKQAPDLFRGVIIENAFSSISDIADSMFWYLAPVWGPVKDHFQKVFWDNNLIVPHVTNPLLFITGDKDEITPHTMILKLHKAASKSVHKDLLIVKDGTHNDTWLKGKDEYLAKLEVFLKECIKNHQLGDIQEAAAKEEETKDAKPKAKRSKTGEL